MSLIDKLYTRCQRDETALPTYFINQILHVGEKIFEEDVRKKLIKNSEEKRNFLFNTLAIKREGDKYPQKYDRAGFWQTLPENIKNCENHTIFNIIKNNTLGPHPEITKEEEETLINYFGFPQLDDYIKQKQEESYAEYENAVVQLEIIKNDLQQVIRCRKEVEETIDILKKFDSFIESLKDGPVDKELVDKFIERRIRAKNGIRLKVE